MAYAFISSVMNILITINWSRWAEIATVLGAVLATTGLIMLLIEIKRKKISDGRKTLIFHDFFRHLFVNTAIIELVRQRIENAGGYDEVYPEEGVFDRMHFLPDDFTLSRFRSSDACFDDMHDLELLMRNYCISLDIAKKHLSDPDMHRDVKIEDLNDIDRRAKSLIVTIYILARDLKLKKIKPIHEVIQNKYHKELRPFEPVEKINRFCDHLSEKAEFYNLDKKYINVLQIELLYNKYFVSRKDGDHYVRVIKFNRKQNQ